MIYKYIYIISNDQTLCELSKNVLDLQLQNILLFSVGTRLPDPLESRIMMPFHAHPKLHILYSEIALNLKSDQSLSTV